MAGGKIDILVEPNTKGFNRALESSLGSALGIAGKLGAGIGVALGLGSVASDIVSVGTEYQSQLNTMAAVSQATAGQMDAVRAKARELGNDISLTGTSASDAAAAMTELAKNGLTVAQSMEASKGTLQLAAAAQIDAAQAATIQGQALQAFGLGAQEAGRVSDILAGSANASAAEITDVAQALQQAGTVSHAFGVSIDDTSTAISMFANAGITGSDAGTLLKTSLLALTDQGKPAQNAIHDLGLTVYDAQGKFVGLPSLIGQLNAASNRMTEEQYQAATATLFGSDAMRFASIAAGKTTEDFNALKEAVTRQGQAAEVAAAQTKGLPGALERLANAKEDLTLGLFEALQDDLVAAADAGTAALGKIGPAAESGIHLASDAVHGLVTALTPVAGLASTLASDFTGPLLGIAAVMALKNWTDFPTKIQQAAQSMATMKQGVADLQEYYRKGHKAISAFDAKTQYMITSSNGLTQALGRSREAFSSGSEAMQIAAKRYFYAGNTIASNAAKIGNAAAGAAKGGLSLMKSAAGGLVDALGGPWAVGIMVAGAVIGGFVEANHAATDAQRKLASATKATQAAQNDLAKAVSGTTGALTEQAKKAAEQLADASLTQLTAVGKAREGFISHADPTRASSEWNSLSLKEQQEATRSASEISDAYEVLKAKLTATGLSMENLNSIVAEGGDDYKKLVRELRAAGEEGERAAGYLEKSRKQIEDTIAAARRVDPAAAQAAKGIDTLADSSANANDKLNALESVMQAMGLAPIAAEEALASAAQAATDIAKSAETANHPVEELGENLGDLAAGKLDRTNNSANELAKRFATMRQELEKVATAGGPVNEAYKQFQGTFTTLGQEFGLTTEQVQHLADAYGVLPREITTLVGVNSEGAKKELATVWAQLYPLKAGTSIEVKAVGDQAMGVLKDLGVKAEKLPDGINMKLTATDADAVAKLGEVAAKADAIGDKTVDVKLLLDDTKFTTNAAAAKNLVDDLAIQKPSPQAQLIIDEFLKSGEIAKGDLYYLTGLSARPQAELNKDLFDAGFNTTKEQLDSLTRTTAMPTVDANTAPARNKIQALWDFLGSFNTVLALGTSAAAVAVAPKKASGGRLPTAGPGTDTTDGILAVNPRGTPVAWVDAGEWIINRRSADQYNRTLRHLNQGDGPGALAALYNELPRHATGGRVQKVKTDLAPLDGTPYILGGFSLAGVDCSGAVSAAVNSWENAPIFQSRMSTATEGPWLAAHGALPGRGNPTDFQIGWWDNGGGANGHTALRLPDGTYIESGGNTGGGLTIGRGAGPLDGRGFTNWMHFSGSAADLNLPALELAFSSLTGGGASVSWGEAQSLHDLAIKYLGAKVYDQGGILPHGGVAVNLSGHPEMVLPPTLSQAARSGQLQAASPELARAVDKLTAALAGATAAFVKAAKELDAPVRAGSKELAAWGGGFLGKSQVVIDAEKGLVDTRKAIADESKDIADAEKELTKARKDLSKTERDNADKLIDAQDRLRKARSKDKASAEDIADAERNLAKVREDAPEKSQEAAEKIAQQEEKLAEARKKAADSAKRLEAAERTVTAAYYQALADLIDGVSGHLASAAGHFGEFFDTLGKAAEIADSERKAIGELQQSQIRNGLALQKSLLDLQTAEWDVHTARAQGAISVAQAEKQLAETRKQQALLGSTGIEAMGAALDRFRTTGVFSIGQVADSVVAQAAAVKAAEWAVAEARAQAAADQHAATQKQALAQLDVADATLTQANTAEMLRIKTAALTQQTAQLYGLTPAAAQGASAGFSGIGKLLGGLGKLAAGIAGGAAGFAAGGPLGAIPGATIALGGLGDLVRGGFDLFNNRQSVKEAWKGMGLAQKAGVVLGGLGGGALAIGGAALTPQYGAEAAIGGAKLADQWTDAVLGGMAHGVESKIAAIQRQTTDRTDRLGLATDAQKLLLDTRRQQLELAGAAKAEALKAQVDYANLQKQLAEATTKAEIDALTEAARVAATKRDAMLVLAARQAQAAESQLAHTRALVDAARSGATQAGVKTIDINVRIPDGVNTFTRADVARITTEAVRAATGADYVNARI
jgi:phage tail tape measure protein, TP901 family|nr:MAG TPA: minor tail protein [Caudoviricetes sp.]